MLVTRDGALSQTSAIMRFIAGLREDTARSLLGSTAMETSTIEQWLAVCATDVRPTVSPRSSQGDKKRLTTVLQSLDRRLGGTGFLVGDRLTLADVELACTLMPVVEQSGGQHTEVGSLHQLRRWYASCRQEPAFVEIFGPRDAPVAAAGGAGAATAAGDDILAREDAPLSSVECSLEGPRTRLSSLLEAVDQGIHAVGRTVTVAGWARTSRKLAKDTVMFVALTDGSCVDTLQVVVRQGTDGFDEVFALGTPGSSLRVVGEIIASPAKGQAIELQAACSRVLCTADPTTYPIPKPRKSGGITLKGLRSIQHLRPRTAVISAVARVRSALAFATHSFFQSRGFHYVHTPLITCSDCEGAGEMFRVSTLMPETGDSAALPLKEDKVDYSKDFFGRAASLTVSGQLQAESYAASMGDVYTFGPAFRAEDARTNRHLSEFWMIEPELAFADLSTVMDVAEQYVKYCVRHVLERCAHDLAYLDEYEQHEEALRVKKGEQRRFGDGLSGLRSRLQEVVEGAFERVTYTEAVELLCTPAVLEAAKFDVVPRWGVDLGSEHERYLTDVVFQKPVVITDYPKDIKAFYMKQNTDGRTVRAMDVLVPGIGELIGGSQREEVLDVLEARMDEVGMDKESLQWYLDLRKYGSVPHSGFGVGFERLVMLITGMSHIRDVIPFPRWSGRADV